VSVSRRTCTRRKTLDPTQSAAAAILATRRSSPTTNEFVRTRAKTNIFGRSRARFLLFLFIPRRRSRFCLVLRIFGSVVDYPCPRHEFFIRPPSKTPLGVAPSSIFKHPTSSPPVDPLILANSLPRTERVNCRKWHPR